MTFYVQPMTQDVRWSLSPRSALAEPAAEEGEEVGVALDIRDGQRWIKVTEGSEEYFYNPATGVSQWDRPPGFVEAA